VGCVARFPRFPRSVALGDDLKQVWEPQGLTACAADAIPVVEIDDSVAKVPARHSAFGREITAHTVMSDRQTRGLLNQASSPNFSTRAFAQKLRTSTIVSRLSSPALIVSAMSAFAPVALALLNIGAKALHFNDRGAQSLIFYEVASSILRPLIVNRTEFSGGVGSLEGDQRTGAFDGLVVGVKCRFFARTCPFGLSLSSPT
jgi:hypothetical protein